MADEKIIITMTSWTKRITNVPKTLSSILSNTVKPHKIVVNLAVEEFPQKEASLPGEVSMFFYEHRDIICVNWLSYNTFVWKKIIPTLYLYPHDCVICIDDDRIYHKTFIKEMIDAHKKYPNSPITGANVTINHLKQHCGVGSLDMLKFFGSTLTLINDAIVLGGSTDTFYTWCYKKNGKTMQFSGKNALAVQSFGGSNAYSTGKPFVTNTKKAVNAHNGKRCEKIIKYITCKDNSFDNDEDMKNLWSKAKKALTSNGNVERKQKLSAGEAFLGFNV